MRAINSNITDNELLIKYKSTENADFLATLFERYFHLIYGACLKNLEDEDNAKDVCMEVYELLSVKLIQHEVTHFKSWLYRVTFNQCMQFLRKKNKLKKNIQEYQLNYTEDMEFSLETHQNIQKEEMLTHLEECIMNLKDSQKQCIELFYLKQLCYNQIAAQTKHTLKKVKSYIQNGKRNLKICLESKNG